MIIASAIEIPYRLLLEDFAAGKVEARETRSDVIKILFLRAVVVAQLVERSLPTPEIHDLNPVIDKIVSTNLSSNCIIEKTEIKKKRPGMGHLKKILFLLRP